MHPLLRFTLDLFDPPDPAPQRDLGGALPSADVPGIGPARPIRPGRGARTVSDEQPGLATRPGAAPVAQVHFRHPRASRELVLGTALVAFEFKRGRRRTIGFVVSTDGLVVHAPKWVPLYEVDVAVREKSAWILAKLVSARERQARMESTRVEWRDGTTIPFLGAPVIVVLDPRHAFGVAGAVLDSQAEGVNPSLSGVPHLTLHVALPHSASAEQIRDSVQAWLMRQAKRIFSERLDHFAPRLQVRWRRLSLSSAGTRWGSASADGSIRLNWRLVHFRQDVIDYVVAHELSHLRVMDHSPRFWETVRSVVPDYAQLRGQLKDETLPRWN